jgi:hypothetical protein
MPDLLVTRRRQPFAVENAWGWLAPRWNTADAHQEFHGRLELCRCSDGIFILVGLSAQ